VAGVRIHYKTGGQGPVVVLLHGYAQTKGSGHWLMDEAADQAVPPSSRSLTERIAP
jgi:pimeloyl-ACP methyl ester carboxylesterase